MWDYSGYANYHALQTSLTRRFDERVRVLGVLRLEQGAGHQQHRLLRRACRISPTQQTRRLDYSYLDYDRPHNFVVNFIYQTPKVAKRCAGPRGERLAALGRLPLDERPALHRRLLDSGHQRREPDRDDGNPERARRR